MYANLKPGNSKNKTKDLVSNEYYRNETSPLDIKHILEKSDT